MPLIDRAPIVVPWYAIRRATAFQRRWLGIRCSMRSPAAMRSATCARTLSPRAE